MRKKDRLVNNAVRNVQGMQKEIKKRGGKQKSKILKDQILHRHAAVSNLPSNAHVAPPIVQYDCPKESVSEKSATGLARTGC